MNSSVGLNYNSDITFSKNSVKITVVTSCHCNRSYKFEVDIDSDTTCAKLTKISFKRAFYTIAVI
jgi:hypothetical protein